MNRRYGPHVDSVREDDIVTITLNRPQRLNAFAGTMRSDLRDALQDTAAGDATIVVITGAGGSFSVGADLDALWEMLESGDLDGFVSLVRTGVEVVRTIRSAPQIVIASVAGAAAGAGASLAAACDLRIAADSARVGFTFCRIGLHPDWGATHTLPGLVGTARAMELFVTGRMVDAPEAMRIGMLDRVVASADLGSQTTAWARELTRRGHGSRSAVKSLFRTTEGPALERAFAAELEAQVRCFGAPDVRDAVQEFLARRGDRRDRSPRV